MLNRQEVQRQNEKKKRFEQRNKQLLSCQKKLAELQKELLSLKNDPDGVYYDIETLDFDDDDAVDEYLDSLEKERKGEEEKKSETVDVVKYLEGYGITADMMDESSLQMLLNKEGEVVKDDDDDGNRNKKIESSLKELFQQQGEVVKNVQIDNNQLESFTHEDLFEETKKSLICFQKMKTKQVSDLVTSPRYDSNGKVVDPHTTIASLQVINSECMNVQSKLWDLCERQQASIMRTKEKLDKLEKDLNLHRNLIVKFQKQYGDLLERTSKESEQKQRKGSTVTVVATGRIPRRIKRVIGFFIYAFSGLANTKLYRVLRAAYLDVKAQNIDIQIDLTSVMKLIVFMLVFGARTAHNGSPSSKKNLPFYTRYRPFFLCSLSVSFFLLQSGIAIFMYKFAVRDWARLWREDGVAAAANAANAANNPDAVDIINNNDPNQRRAQRQHINPNPGNNREAVRTLTHGVIQPRRDEGVLHDIKYFVASFVLSLLPTWRPVGIETPPAGDTGNNPVIAPVEEENPNE